MRDLHELAPEKDAARHGSPSVVSLQAWKELGILASPFDMREAPTGEPGSDCGPREVDRTEMKETVIVLRVQHKKPLPPIATDIIAQRAYSWLYSQGVEAGVTATLAELPKEPGKEGK